MNSKLVELAANLKWVHHESEPVEDVKVDMDALCLCGHKRKYHSKIRCLHRKCECGGFVAPLPQSVKAEDVKPLEYPDAQTQANEARRVEITHPSMLELAERVAAWFKKRPSADGEEFAASFAAAVLPNGIRSMEKAVRQSRDAEWERVIKDAWVHFAEPRSRPDDYLAWIRSRLAQQSEKTREQDVEEILAKHLGYRDTGHLLVKECAAEIVSKLKEPASMVEKSPRSRVRVKPNSSGQWNVFFDGELMCSWNKEESAG